MGLTTHGLSKHRLYNIWTGMMKRCYSTKSDHFKNYGARGIKVCQEWHTPEKFVQWGLSHGYADGLQIDRIDNNKGYSPNNCRFVNIKSQANNRTNNVFIEIDGETKTYSQWAEYSGINYTTLRTRYRKGLRGEQLFAPVRKQKGAM